MSHPTAVQLLEAVGLFLREAEAALPGRLGFHAKVARNVVAIVCRELAQDPDSAEARALAAFGGPAAVSAGLRSGELAPDDPALLAALAEAVIARLAVDNPRYPTLARLRAPEDSS
ncbi:MAG: DUF6285 domain-containing protein [Thermaurantiacus tibetensis]|uniref:DUF6285 domain-containing protein n=1 Tax=Thermaurantiacus tibetensis TaxID=2759035 RepID=UPI00188EBB2C|nr:DUF6285 domain-containing protein [Thermaurantiacus tibetensis]